MARPNVLQCKVSNMKVSDNGLKDYYWPISNQERTAFARQLMEEMADLLMEFGIKDEHASLPYKFFSFNFLTNATAIFQGDLLRERCAKDNVKINVPHNWDYWPSLIKYKTPKLPKLLENLQNGPQKINYFKKLLQPSLFLKIFKNAKSIKNVNIDGLKIKPITRDVLVNNIISTQRTDLIVRHAANINNDVIFCRSNRWFQSINTDDFKTSILENNVAFEDAVIEAITKLYADYGMVLMKHSENYVRQTLSHGAALCRVHYERLLKKPEDLPKTLWTGTTGAIWDTMLRVAALQNGAKVTAHDHGSGVAYVDFYLEGFHELWGCHDFVTFNENHAKEMLELTNSWKRFDKENPNIIFFPPSNAKKIKEFTRFSTPQSKPKTIYYMATLFDNDRGRAGPGNVNNFLVDWEAQLISNLRSYGYDVVIKIHPETKEMPPPDFESKLGATVTKHPFTSIMDKADVVIFDCIYTTAFSDCLATNIPMVLIDFFDFPITDKAHPMLKKRVDIVKTDYVDCRARPNWRTITQAIENSPSKSNNHDFYTHYFL